MPDSAPQQPFSRRQGLQPAPSGPPVWDDAPEALRVRLLSVLSGEFAWSWKQIRRAACAVFGRFPNPDNNSESYVQGEVQDLIAQAPWFKIYDLIEAVSHDNETALAEAAHSLSFADLINQALEELNLGWRMQGGQLVAMGDDVSRPLLDDAVAALGSNGLQTAQRELQEAVRDLSRRPEPDCSGAVQHAMAALEAVARMATGEPNPTFGQLLSRHRDLLREPLRTGLDKLWGYASDQARHGREGNRVERVEAHAVVSIAAAVVPYLLAKLPQAGSPGGQNGVS